MDDLERVHRVASEVASVRRPGRVSVDRLNEQPFVGKGVDVAARLRSRQPTARVLFVSGYRAEEGSLPRAADGKVHFLPKPFTAAQLTERVCELVDASA